MTANRRLEVGDKVPDFTLPDSGGSPRQLSGLARDGRVVLIFYRGYW